MIKCGTMVEGLLLANRLTSLLGKGPSIKDVSSKGRRFNTVAAHLRAAMENFLLYQNSSLLTVTFED